LDKTERRLRIALIAAVFLSFLIPIVPYLFQIVQAERSANRASADIERLVNAMKQDRHATTALRSLVDWDQKQWPASFAGPGRNESVAFAYYQWATPAVFCIVVLIGEDDRIVHATVAKGPYFSGESPVAFRDFGKINFENRRH
jgi:hypothetical protein